jgi:hypothetical protein
MSKSSPSRMSAARRRAETILNQSQKRQESFRLDQEREREAMTQKTERLRALRLAKEAADKEAAAAAPAPVKRTRARRSKQT